MFHEIPSARPDTPLLDSISDPADLRQLPEADLPQLADELRHFLLYTVGQTGGHFGAGLGAIELTIALHYCFETPEDDLLWDVGHQTYPHKILTGRRELMQTLRQKGGIAPFPSREESPYDVFGTGHSSTSISAALGLQLANEIAGRDDETVVVIGDGAMTAGMAFEALNHVAASQANLLIILNDNAMSISENVGGLANYFARNISAHHMTDGGSAESQPGSIFTDLGLHYAGPVDGHDLSALLGALKNIRQQSGPRILHVVTRKGKGYAPAEASPVDSHSLTKLEKTVATSPGGPTYSSLFGNWACDKAADDKRLVAITPAMKEGSGLTGFAGKYPERFHDVAIAEQHAVTLAAGLAAGGAKPVVAIYSTFLQRAYDQLIHDVAIQNLDVLFAVDRASLLEDGPTHSGVFDLAFTRTIPNLTILSPADADELKVMLDFGFEHEGPVLVRFPRGAAPSQLPGNQSVISLGKSETLRSGSRIALLAFGATCEAALVVGDRLDATVIDMRFIKPLDQERIREIASDHNLLVTLEEGSVAGGAGSAVNELLISSTRPAVINIGVPDRFIEHDDPQNMRDSAGLSPEAIEQKIMDHLNGSGSEV